VVRAEKLAGVGRLAAGVAHEVRNPLGALATYVEVLRRRNAEPEIIAEMQTAIDRIERTVQSLLDYSRPGRGTGRVDMSEAVRKVLDFLGAQGALRQVQVCVAHDPAVPPVRGDAHALEQVIVNLALNARDAVAPRYGRIWIGVQARTLEPGHRTARRSTETTGGPPPDREFRARPRRPDVPRGTAGVFVYVADDGPGVPEADRERIFDPFHTTKDPGSGTGLGLAIVARTVHEAGGMVWVDPAREGGACFKVFLPAMTDDADTDR
jgi:two-component system NtrC family sensor kinase